MANRMIETGGTGAATAVTAATGLRDFYHARTRWSGLGAWIFSTDHKRIGLMYLILMFCFFTVGMTLGFLMRLEMIAPGKTIMSAQTYNTIFTLHGVIMIFLFVIPGLSAVSRQLPAAAP